MTASSPDDPMELRHHTVGYPLDGVTLQLEDSADEEDLVMRVDASCRFSGYCDPETGLVVDPAPDIWKTGDLIRLHDGPDGQKRIEVLGRADHAVKRDGLFVHLGKIEECISDAEGVESVAVVVSGMTRRGVGLVAFCQTDGSDAATADAILAHARAALPPRAVPDRIAFIDKMPLLDSGKLNRRQLTALADSQEASDKAAG